MDRHFLPTGRVSQHPCSDHASGPDGHHLITSRLTGAVQAVRVRRKLVDTGYLEGRIPATSPPPFKVATGLRCVAAGEVPRVAHRPERHYLSSYLALMAHDRARAAHPAVVAWAKVMRLNPMSGMGAHRAHPLVAQTWGELKQYGAMAAGNIVKLLQ